MTSRKLALEAILDGRLKLLLQSDRTRWTVLGWHRRRKHWKEIRQHRHPKSGRWRINYGPSRASIYMNVLAFLWLNRCETTKYVDHINLNRTDDSPDNLQEHTPEESGRQGYDRQTELALQDWTDFLELVGHLQ